LKQAANVITGLEPGMYRLKERDCELARLLLGVDMEIIKAMDLTRDSCQFLIIDDDPHLARFLVAYLRHKGHSCQALTEGFETAAWLAHHDCEVAIVDLKMPKVDGISLIAFIREISPRLPIVVFTGLGYDEEQMQAALRAGANGYVSKNLPIEQLYCVLARVLATCQRRPNRGTVQSHGGENGG
jgi:DNA-binding response OmpR family regulator